MERKHYIELVRIIRENLADCTSQREAGRIVDAETAIGYLADDIAEFLVRDNPKFDTERFMQACGIGYFQTLEA